MHEAKEKTNEIKRLFEVVIYPEAVVPDQQGMMTLGAWARPWGWKGDRMQLARLLCL
ncbi:hypothetical protein P7K49_031342, partial [Saguinus oedipus]